MAFPTSTWVTRILPGQGLRVPADSLALRLGGAFLLAVKSTRKSFSEESANRPVHQGTRVTCLCCIISSLIDATDGRADLDRMDLGAVARDVRPAHALAEQGLEEPADTPTGCLHPLAEGPPVLAEHPVGAARFDRTGRGPGGSIVL